ncbi:DNA-directed RNA polymerase, subunit beta-prime [Artemisia annua]|uniref:DNA-directed RNA polymerase, subunit beta-prime n=1 Tax=Artemisia annua TaxID=35608 RepID=A0A2U1P6E2_ARTAN|nr:DNA-directed RNA polymerase, subunit beta-prime [Artemisia annua]
MMLTCRFIENYEHQLDGKVFNENEIDVIRKQLFNWFQNHGMGSWFKFLGSNTSPVRKIRWVVKELGLTWYIWKKKLRVENTLMRLILNWSSFNKDRFKQVFAIGDELEEFPKVMRIQDQYTVVYLQVNAYFSPEVVVDALLDNGICGQPIRDDYNRVYKSFSDVTEGKEGRVCETFLAKRFEYSRSKFIARRVVPTMELSTEAARQQQPFEVSIFRQGVSSFRQGSNKFRQGTVVSSES